MEHLRSLSPGSVSTTTTFSGTPGSQYSLRRSKSPGQPSGTSNSATWIIAPFPFGSCDWSEEDEAALQTAAETGWAFSLNSTTAIGPASLRWETLDMTGMNLNLVSPVINHFTNITSLFLSYNRLGTIPEELLSLTHLRCLHVASNGISVIPPGIDRLQELRELDISNNFIRQLPLEMGRLWRLLQLNIDGNPLEFPPTPIIHSGPLLTIEYLRDRLPPPPIPPKRKWHQVEQVSPDDFSRPLLRVMTYNVLAESYGTAEQYAYCPSWALDWEYRKQKIVEEITMCNADIVCLQEVEGRQFLEYFQPILQNAGYGSFFRPKSRARTKENWTSVDGCAMFYRMTKLRLLEEYLLEYQGIALNRFHDLTGDHTGFDRLMLKDNIAIAGLFEIARPTPHFVLIANTHIHWDPSNSDLKLMQVQFMLEELYKISSSLHQQMSNNKGITNNTVPLLCAGDFNAMPNSGVYQLLHQGSVPPNHPDFNNSNFGKYTIDGLRSDFALKSAYASVGEPEYTNHSGDFTGVLDYLWYTSDSMRVLQVLDVLSLSEMEILRSPLPNPHFASDHVHLLADFQLR